MYKLDPCMRILNKTLMNADNEGIFLESFLTYTSWYYPSIHLSNDLSSILASLEAELLTITNSQYVISGALFYEGRVLTSHCTCNILPYLFFI